MTVALIVAATNQTVFAQHEGHTMPMPPAKPAASPTTSPSPEMPAEETVMDLMPKGRMGSGTSWQPDSSPMFMVHKQSGEWLLMFHYNFVAGVNSQGGPRGVTKFESANWFMGSAARRVGPGTLELRGMVSAEPFTFPPGGSPLLFQTGESYKGEPLIDRQHPHDLFMELSATYTVPVSERASWFVYAGYPGEPALGPNAFMHRASASENSSAPLSHHLQDSSHISFGVFTTGFQYRWFKLEGSLFNGREPGENRYNFEAHPWNSRSARLWFAPNSNWTMQVSHGLLRNPEALEPGDVRRTTASVSYNRKFERGNWASSLIWGRNHESHDGDGVLREQPRHQPGRHNPEERCLSGVYHLLAFERSRHGRRFAPPAPHRLGQRRGESARARLTVRHRRLRPAHE